MLEEAYNFIEKEEGGYVDDLLDSGGATNGGVTQETYDSYRKFQGLTPQPVIHLSEDEKRDIYKRIFHDCHADYLPRGLNLMHFDAAVNCGDHQAALFLQRSVGTKDDGFIGPKTLAAVDAQDLSTVLPLYASLRADFYRNLAQRRPKDKKFLGGWLKRTERCLRKALLLMRDET